MAHAFTVTTQFKMQQGWKTLYSIKDFRAGRILYQSYLVSLDTPARQPLLKAMNINENSDTKYVVLL